MAHGGGWHTEAIDRLGIDLPIVGAPMGGGPSTPALVAAVSETGGLGSLAGGYLSAERLRADIRAVRELTSRPFAVNLFIPTPVEPTAQELETSLRALEAFRSELGLPARPATDGRWAEDFDAQVAVLVEERVPVTSFTFGLLPEAAVAALHDAGSVLVGTATTVDEALVGTLALVPQVCDAVGLPVIAAGGIMDGRGIAAVLGLGAGAAVLGTAFLRTPEAGTSPPHRRALASATETSTAVTAAITGRAARGIENRLMRDLRDVSVPGYPVMHTLTSELRRRAAERDQPDLMS